MKMKKWLKNVLLLTGLILISLLVVCIVKLVNNSFYEEITTAYEYPIVPGMEEWKQLDSHVKKLEACQIPEDILENLTTPALVETVMNYPLLIDMLAYDTVEIGYQAVYGNFNGLRELQERKDAITCLEKYLSDVEKQTVSEGDSHSVLLPMYVEGIIAGIDEATK